MRVERVVVECHAVRYGDDRPPLVADQNNADYVAAKSNVLEYERALLYSINYDFDIVNLLPVHYLEGILGELGKVGVDLNQKFSQQCWNFVQDSHRTSLGLQYQPKKIASACVFLAFVKLRALPIDDKARLASIFGVLNISKRSLNAICTHMAELYVDMRARHNHQLISDLHHQGHVPTDLYNRSRSLAAEVLEPQTRAA